MIHFDVDEQERENRKNLYISVGAEIKERRKELGITQEDMAERIGKTLSISVTLKRVPGNRCFTFMLTLPGNSNARSTTCSMVVIASGL